VQDTPHPKVQLRIDYALPKPVCVALCHNRGSVHPHSVPLQRHAGAGLCRFALRCLWGHGARIHSAQPDFAPICPWLPLPHAAQGVADTPDAPAYGRHL